MQIYCYFKTFHKGRLNQMIKTLFRRCSLYTYNFDTLNDLKGPNEIIRQIFVVSGRGGLLVSASDFGFRGRCSTCVRPSQKSDNMISHDAARCAPGVIRKLKQFQVPILFGMTWTFTIYALSKAMSCAVCTCYHSFYAPL